MSTYLNYMIEANIGLLVFLVFYHILLKRETDFSLLRIFMLSGIFASLFFPLMHFQNDEIPSPLSVGHVIPASWLPQMVIGTETEVALRKTSFDLWTYITFIYIIGLLFFSVSVLFQLRQLLRMIRHSRTYRIEKLHVAESTQDKPTFSFFNFIFIGKVHALSTDEKQQIIRHEAVHAGQWHSFDILLINCLKIFFWFNPFINTYKKVFIQLHEFEADARAVENSDLNKYCSLLAKVALGSADFSLANHFNSSLTVKRIAMIRSAKNRITHWKVAACALLLPATFMLVSCQDQLGKTDLHEIFSEVDEPANPQGGLESFYNLIRKNITYPAESRADHKYGKVLVQFVVNENGSLADIEVLESPDELLGNEAIRMLTLTPPWTPAKKEGRSVKQQMVMPIDFRLDFPGQINRQQRENASRVRDEKTSLQEIVVIGYANK